MREPGTALRLPAVAGAFYPAGETALRALVAACLAEAGAPPPGGLASGVLVPHAGLVYSGTVAAAGWATMLLDAASAPTIVVLGTNHSARFDGVAVFEAGLWRTPLGDVSVDADLAARILALDAPFGGGRLAHRDEHSIEVQLPLLQVLRPEARIVPCSVAAGTGRAAVGAGARLGGLLAGLRAAGEDVLLAISTDMAHYPPHDEAVRVTQRLVPAITAVDGVGLAVRERVETQSGARGMACGMCGIQPAVLGLAALRAMGATGGTVVASATSADAGSAPDRTVGYLAVVFN